MPVLEEVRAVITDVATTVGPAVVGIGQGWGLGSGVVIDDGLVLTNAHNVRGGGVSITFHDGRVADGHVRGADVDGDLAVVAVDTGGVTPVEWASEPAEVGTAVLGVANPGGRGLRVTLGTVSSVGQSFRGPRGRKVTGSVEHTAPMARGSSGGPVVDAAGRFVGLNTNRLGEGFYLAIPADRDLRARVDALAKGHSATRRYLGVGLLPGRAARQLRRSVGLPDRDGVLVRAVEDGSPARRAGLRRGDLIVEAGGRPVASVDDLFEAVDSVADGESLALRVVRGADELETTVSFGPASASEEGSA